MKKVLWISRHMLTREQMHGLEKVCGGPVELHWWQENVEDPADLKEVAASAEVIAAVLPLELLAELMVMAGERPVLISLARRKLVPVEGGEPMALFAHGGWYRIRHLQVELEPADQVRT